MRCNNNTFGLLCDVDGFYVKSERNQEPPYKEKADDDGIWRCWFARKP